MKNNVITERTIVRGKEISNKVFVNDVEQKPKKAKRTKKAKK